MQLVQSKLLPLVLVTSAHLLCSCELHVTTLLPLVTSSRLLCTSVHVHVTTLLYLVLVTSARLLCASELRVTRLLLLVPALFTVKLEAVTAAVEGRFRRAVAAALLGQEQWVTTIIPYFEYEIQWQTL